MLYVFTSMHNLSFADRRAEIFEEHKAYVHGIGPQIRFAGPLLQDDDTTMIGGMVVAEFDSRESAMTWFANEPFNRAGILTSTSVQVFDNRWPPKPRAQ